MGKRGWRIPLGIALALPGIVGGAGAQTTSSSDWVTTCACQERLVSSLNGEVQAQSRAYEDKRRSFEALDQEVQTTRPRVDVKNPAEVDAFKQLLDRRDAAADTLNGQANENYAAAVKRYNDAVADYNDYCAAGAAGSDRRPLVCPKP